MENPRKYTAQEKRALAAFKPQVPDSWDEFAKNKAKPMTLLDRMEVVVRKHWHEEPELRTQITAINGVDSWSGSAKLDRGFAAARIKELADGDGDATLASTAITDIANKIQLLKHREGQADSQVLRAVELLQAQRAAEGLREETTADDMGGAAAE
jgi:predicted ATPase